ncbi:MAG: hypothetical protein K2O05_03085 [Anaeroplasmataceae bacterium]|nr:hypothetical protein [Anaeroplasmataceae bacterium]
MSKDMSTIQQQRKIDYDKWLDSERKKKDMCGTYDFCKYCDKTKENPCANAVEAISKALNETAYVSNKA